jgi:ubiquinone/menaquinone biosynthesis C-methylase UbiE
MRKPGDRIVYTSTMTHSPAGSDAARFFDRFAVAFDTIYDGKRNVVMRWVDRHFRSDMFIRFGLTFDSLGDLTGKTLLDVGCGSGPYVVEALRRGAKRVTAVDPAPRMLAMVQERLKAEDRSDGCALICGEFPDVKVEVHDCAIVMGVMDYVRDARRFLEALRRVVTGTAVVSFPSRHWFRTPLRKLRYQVRRCPVYFYDEADIDAICSAAGFGQVTIRKIAGAGMDYHTCLRP